MVLLGDTVGDANVVALLDPGVLRDVAAALSGLWDPSEEVDLARRASLEAAGRLRLYADHERGWVLLTTQQARDGVDARGDADWSAGFIPPVEEYDDAPAAAELEALTRLYHHDDGLDGEAARSLAVAVMCDHVQYLVTREPSAFKHRREHDLPERLEIVDTIEAVNRLRLAPGEEPTVGPLPGSALADGAAWWVP